ncbi:dimethyladenosine transferase 2, mitochondrial [Sabethes cyaneus]|uniref:dimethyladenosine transferase 2, mitochondrial n=1 Tax=Sabethes cyaneus TaxID=53552 RepID=UPI00237E38BF|nr:dimethyladenosine transferase 2, mitochondrial [Sabethes cyaneus]
MSHSVLKLNPCRQSLYGIVYRSWSSEATRLKRKDNSELTSNRKQKTPGKPNRLEKEIRNFFQANSNETILGQLPAEMLNQCPKQTDRLYIGTPECASIVQKHVTAGLSKNTLLAEVNPGPGLLTRELLNSGMQKLLLIEGDEYFEPTLRNLMASHSDTDWSFKVANFNGHWRHMYYECEDNRKKIRHLLEGIPKKRWKDEPNLRLFSIVDSAKFFKSMVSSLAAQTGLFSLGRCEMVLIVPPLTYVQFTSTKEAGYNLYRQHSVLFQLLFEHELLTTIPRKHILPWASNPTKRKVRTERARYEQLQKDEWYLMRIVPRQNLHDFCSPDNLKLLKFFVYQHLISRKNRIVPAMEKWIPYCGARLILNQNYVPSGAELEREESLPLFLQKSSPLRKNDLPERVTIFTEFGELTPSQILAVFDRFISWPEFQQSPFIQSAEQYQKRPLSVLKQSSDAIADEEEDHEEDSNRT